MIVRFAAIVVGTLLLTTVAGCSPRSARREDPPPAPAAPSPGGAGVEELWGVRIIGIRLSGGGHMLDFRYRVLDAAKAAPLFVRQVKPQLIDQASGRTLIVPSMPKVGPLRTSDAPRAETNYWMFFENTGRLVKAGSKVTVVIGDFRVEDLVVE